MSANGVWLNGDKVDITLPEAFNKAIDLSKTDPITLVYRDSPVAVKWSFYKGKVYKIKQVV